MRALGDELGTGAGLEPEIQLQRMRVLHAFAEIAWEEGLAEATPVRVCAVAGVPERLVQEQFACPEECVREAFEVTVERARRRMAVAAAGQESWAPRMRAGLAALLAHLEEEPELARLSLAYSLASGAALRRRRRQVFAELEGALADGSPCAVASDVPRDLLAKAAVGAVLLLLQERLLVRDPAPPLVETLDEFMGVLLLPYRGAQAG